MRMLHIEYVENFDYDKLCHRHAPGLDLVLLTAERYTKINDLRPVLLELLKTAKETADGPVDARHVPGLELVIEWSEHCNRLWHLTGALNSLLKIAKDQPETVSSGQ